MKKLLLVGMALLFVSTITFSQNIIRNGSFELPGMTGNAGDGREKFNAGSTNIFGWLVGIDGDVYVHKSPNIGLETLIPAQDGSFYLDLSGDGAPHGTVYQDFSTALGTQYQLTFFIGASSWTPLAPTINVTLLDQNVLLNTTLTPLAPNGDNINWLEETFFFTANTNITRLSFVDTSGSDDNASFVDNVSVQEVPEPTILFPLGLLMLALKRRC